MKLHFLRSGFLNFISENFDGNGLEFAKKYFEEKNVYASVKNLNEYMSHVDILSETINENVNNEIDALESIIFNNNISFFIFVNSKNFCIFAASFDE